MPAQSCASRKGDPAGAVGALAGVLGGTAPVIGYVTVVEAHLLAGLAHRAPGDQRAANQAAERAPPLAEADRLILPFAITGSAELLEALPRHETAAVPDLHADVQDIFGHGNEVVVRLVVTGTQEGTLLDIPATGRHLQWDAIDLYRLEGGKISQEWASEDLTAILYDTGTFKAPWIPDPDPAPYTQRPRHRGSPARPTRCRGHPEPRNQRRRRGAEDCRSFAKGRPRTGLDVFTTGDG